MAQYSFGTIDPNTKSGTALATDLNSWRDAVNSTHSGSSAPSYVTSSMLWSDTTSANFELKMYDGAQWIPVAVLDATNNVARVAVDSAETSYITSTTAGQIRHVIANTTVATMRSTGLQFNIAAPVISDSNANELFSFTTVASAVNHIDIANAATGGKPTISTIGSDTNIDLFITAKGTGIVYTYSETAATNTVIDVARLESRSTGTPAAGIGAGLLFAVETAANNFEIGARIEAITTDVTGASEDFDLVFRTMAAGAAAAERMRIGSTGLVNVTSLAIGGTTITATAAELNFVDGVTSNVQTQLNAKANLASPALTGTPTAPTAAVGTNTTQLATTAFVGAEIAADLAGLAAGAVGSYAFLRNSSSNVDTAFGGTLAGSNLFPAGLKSVGGGNTTASFETTTAVSGTWRCMGFSDYASLNDQRPMTLWLRIS